MIDRARREFGEVGLYCANAGVGVFAGLDSPDEAWDLALDVNVFSHITAARALVPRWVERGQGYFPRPRQPPV